MASLVMNPLIGNTTDFFEIKKGVALLPEFSSTSMVALAVLKKNNPSLSIPDFLQTPLSERVAALEAAEQDYEEALGSQEKDQKRAKRKAAACFCSCCFLGPIGWFSSGPIQGLPLLAENAFVVLSVFGLVGSGIFGTREESYDKDMEGYVSKCPDICVPCNLVEKARFLIPHRIEQKRLRVLEKKEKLESSFEEMKRVCAENAEFPLKKMLELAVDKMRSRHKLLWERNFAALLQKWEIPLAGREIVELEGNIELIEKGLRELDAFITLVRKRIL